jgi:transposase InsO family protein
MLLTDGLRRMPWCRDYARLPPLGPEYKDRPISPRSPWQNPYVERLIGTLRRECLDHVLIYGERHLRRVLTLYSLYYNETRTHLGLGKDTPLRRSIQRSGTIVTIPILSGLHHRYARI